ncbi:MAG: hypothetical protein KJ609_09655 [Gammaproteobacteria bacterium]|nr:hypothetical protein [Marinomonas sp. ef1]MBU1293876.1 hypothetical protein [Gammaproteobacteria bacterium]MBU1468083.1 hypothetical protein [Gammaproteobacteria bacterium]MBU2023093.1 hypothetical protein [Gammaproteobacteria bacterium]MBU2237716.1 hypothetical protein [Gammaproteobacteria bacterium]MBU2318798.1 hypothetical protein [Gammaproteobacteria bacterium]
MFKPNYYLLVTAVFVLLVIMTNNVYFQLAWAWLAKARSNTRYDAN